MSRHRSPASLTLIDALVELGNALGYYSDSEFAVTDTGGAVDVAWCQDPTDTSPLFIFEVETAASSSAANNPLKIFGQTNTDLANPLFLFHVFMSRSENSERIRQLETQYGTQNYRTYRLGLDEATGLVTDVLEQHRRVRNSVHILGLIRALGHDGWSTVNVHEVLEHVEKNGFRACYVPHYARLAYDRSYRHHFVRELIRREPYPWPTSDHDCWYTTWLGETYSPPLHLGIVAHEHPELEESAVARLRVWQEKRDISLRQIGPTLDSVRSTTISFLASRRRYGVLRWRCFQVRLADAIAPSNSAFWSMGSSESIHRSPCFRPFGSFGWPQPPDPMRTTTLLGNSSVTAAGSTRACWRIHRAF